MCSRVRFRRVRLTTPRLLTALVACAQDEPAPGCKLPHSKLLIPCLQRRVPVAVGVPNQLHLPRLAAHRAVLHVGLAAPSLILEGELGCFAAVGTHYRDV